MTDFSQDNNIFKTYDLFIFDLDDTLVKTEEYHYDAWLKTLQQIYYKLNKQHYLKI